MNEVLFPEKRSINDNNEIIDYDCCRRRRRCLNLNWTCSMFIRRIYELTTLDIHFLSLLFLHLQMSRHAETKKKSIIIVRSPSCTIDETMKRISIDRHVLFFSIKSI